MMTREERKRAVAFALVNCNGGTDTPERTRMDLALSAGYMAMAEEALRVADATRDPRPNPGLTITPSAQKCNGGVALSAVERRPGVTRSRASARGRS